MKRSNRTEPTRPLERKLTFFTTTTILTRLTATFFQTTRRVFKTRRLAAAFLGAVFVAAENAGFVDFFAPNADAVSFAADGSASFCEYAGLKTIAANAVDGFGLADGFESNAGFADASSTIRGANLSDFPIDPFRGRLFGYVDGSWGKQYEQASSSSRSGFEFNSLGGGGGQDWKLGSNAIWGYGVQGRRLQVDPKSTAFDEKVDSFGGFLHLSVFGSLWRFDLAVGSAKNWNKQTSTQFSSFQNNFASTQWNYEAEFGVRFDKGYTRIEPLVNLRVLTLQEPASSEAFLSAASPYRPSDFTDASYRLKLGSRFSWEYATRFSTLKPFLVASWSHEFGSRSIYVAGDNSPLPIAYRFGKHQMERDRLDLGGGVDAALRDTVDLFFQYDFEIAKNYTEYLFFAGFNKKF